MVQQVEEQAQTACKEFTRDVSLVHRCRIGVNGNWLIRFSGLSSFIQWEQDWKHRGEDMILDLLNFPGNDHSIGMGRGGLVGFNLQPVGMYLVHGRLLDIAAFTGPHRPGQGA